MFRALKALTKIHEDVEVSMSFRYNELTLRLVAGNRTIMRELDVKALQNSNIDALGYMFVTMLHELGKCVESTKTVTPL